MNLHARRVRAPMAFVWLVFLGFPLADIFHSHGSAGELVPVLAGVALFLAIYAALVLRKTPRLADVPGLLSVGVLYALATALTLGSQPSWATLFVFAAAATGAALREPLAPAGIALCTVLAAVAGIASGLPAGAVLGFAAGTAGIGLLVLSIAGLRARNEELHHAREELARLAVADERLRFARDLHDLLGHSLSVIALKAELAGRLLQDAAAAPGEDGEAVAYVPRPARSDVDAARTHVGDLERVARRSLAEVREAVSGYRRPALARELDSAREALAAAGIRASMPDTAPDDLHPDVEALLAWAVREGTTNVIRHSRANSCTVAIDLDADAAGIEISDDGGATRDDRLFDATDRADAASAVRTSSGYGLAGLRERAERLAGRLDAGSAPGGGFRLRVTVPRGGETTVA